MSLHSFSNKYDSIVLTTLGKEICRGKAAIVLFELRQKQKEQVFMEGK